MFERGKPICAHMEDIVEVPISTHEASVPDHELRVYGQDLVRGLHRLRSRRVNHGIAGEMSYKTRTDPGQYVGLGPHRGHRDSPALSWAMG